MTGDPKAVPTLLLILALALCPLAGARAAGDEAPEADAILDAALQAALTFSDPYSRSRSILATARGYAAAGLTDKATEAIDEAARSAALSPMARHALLEVAETCARAGLYTRAAELADSMDHLPDAVYVLCLSARQQFDAADPDGALAALGEARSKADEIPEPEDTARALVRIAEVYARAEMPAQFEAALRAAADAAREATGELGRAVLLEAVADAYRDAGRLDDALRLAGTVEAPESRAPLLTKLAAAYAEAGRSAEAEAVLQDAVRVAATSDDAYQRAFVLLDAAQAAQAAGAAKVAADALDEAERASASIPDKLRKAAVRDRMAPLLAAAGRATDALRIVRQTDDPTRRSEQMLRLATVHAEAGRYEEAVRAAQQADAEVIRLAGTPKLRALGLAYARAWGLQAARERADELKPPGLRDAVLARCAQDLTAEGRFASAFEYAQAIAFGATRDDALGVVATSSLAVADSADALAPARRALELTTGSLDRLKLRLAMAQRMVQLGLREPAREAFRSLAGDVDQVLLHSTRAELLAAVALGLGELGEKDAARETAVRAIVAALQVACAGCRDEAVRHVFQQMSGPEYVDLAFAAAEQIQSPSVRAENFLRMFELNEGLSHAQSERLLRAALAASAQTASPTLRVQQLVLVASYYHRAGLTVTEAEREMLRRSQEAAQTAEADRQQQPPRPAGATGVRLVYFDRPGCPECERVKATFNDLRRLQPRLSIEAFDLATSESAALLNMAICEGLGIAQEQRMVAPSVFSARAGLVGSEVTLAALAELARDAQGMPSPAELFGPKREEARALLADSYADLGLLVVVSAALVDGINPCAFTVIIFFLSYLAYMGRERRQIAAVGIVFTLAVFLTYFGIGLGLMGLVKAAEAWSGTVTKAIYAVTAALVSLAAVLSFRDGVRCLRGHTTDLTLALPEGLRSRIRLTISRRAHIGLTVGATLVLGAIVALFEFPCTGQVYLPVIVFGVRHLPRSAWGAAGWLLLYNAVFILPLIAVFVAVFFGLTSERLTALFRRHVALTKFALAAVFAGLGAYMIVMLVA